MSTGWSIERALAERPLPLHPLAGAGFSLFWRRYVGNGPYTSRSLLQRIISATAGIARIPFYHYQDHQWGHRIREAEIECGPIFIVGHWRSGTTHLHNIMSQDPLFGWLSFVQTVLPSEILIEKDFPAGRKILDRIIPSNRGTDNVALSVDSPQEEEWAIGNLNPLSFFNCYYFPRNYRTHFARGVLQENTTPAERDGLASAYEYLVKSLHLYHGGKPLLFKNPSATARLPFLKKIFPNARFIHIVRNPYNVFASSLARFPRLMSTFAWERFDDVDFDEIVLESYEALMKKYLADRDNIPPEDLIETSYEKLIADPIGEVERIYKAFDLPTEIDAFEKIDDYLAGLRDYEKNTHQLTARQVKNVTDRWGFAFDEWPDYGLPDIQIVD